MEISDFRSQRFKTLQAVLQYFYRDNTRSGAHSRYNLKYHIVWIPKYRREILTGSVAGRLAEVLEDIANTYNLKIIAQEVMPDHVHVLVEAPPKYSPATIVQMFKSISSKKLREEFSEPLRKYIWKDGTLWATGYYAATVADGATTDMVREYIKTQWDRPHKKEPDVK